MMNPALATFLTLAAKSMTGADFDAHVQSVVANRTADADKIEHVALLATDFVRHYEQAVVLGTTADYEEQTMIWHFNSMLNGVDTQCEDIDLFSCVHELICEGKIAHNLKTDMMGCN